MTNIEKYKEKNIKGNNQNVSSDGFWLMKY